MALLLLLAAILVLAHLSLDLRADTIADVARRTMQTRHLPGLALLVIHVGKVLERAVDGTTSLELHTPLSADNRFEIGSITKAFTAALIIKLLEKGKLSLACVRELGLDQEKVNADGETVALGHSLGTSDRRIFAHLRPERLLATLYVGGVMGCLVVLQRR